MKILRLVVVLIFISTLALLCAAQEGGSLEVAVTDLATAAIPRARVQTLGVKNTEVVADLHGVAVVDGLPPGSYKIVVSRPGFRDKVVPDVQVTAGSRQSFKVALEQTPPRFSDVHTYPTFDQHIYSKGLQLLKEPGFCEQPIPAHEESYRFLWVPTFDHPIFMKIQIQQDGTAVLNVKILSGAGGYNWGHVAKSTTRKLSFVEQATLFTTLADIGFWDLPVRVTYVNPYQITLDGTDFVIEGVRDGNCHAITRYASPLTDIFSAYFLGDVAKLKPYLH